MTVLAPNDMKQYALPGTFDAAYLAKLSLQSGETYEQLLADITSALSIQNAAILANPLLASLMSETTEATLEYAVGVSNGFEDHTEYALPDAKRANVAGTMIPLLEKDRALKWTWDFLKKARRSQIDADISSAMADLVNLYEQMALARLFKSTYDGVGSSGKAMPVADGGTADSTYIPINHPDRASAFSYTHNHVGAANGITQAILEAGVAHLWEHGHDAPYDLLISQADVASWANTTNVTGWIKKADGLIRYGNQTDLAQVANDYIAVIETSVYGPVRVRACARIPTAFWSVYKSYGPLDQRNPLILRENPKYGAGAILLAGDHIRQFPFENCLLYAELGFAVADRVGAYICKNTSGSWSEPTIS
jgi:hypothetical protein